MLAGAGASSKSFHVDHLFPGFVFYGKESYPLQDFATAAAEMSPMARSFWADNRRVRNDRLKRELLPQLAYPTYREGLAAVLAAEGGGAAG